MLNKNSTYLILSYLILSGEWSITVVNLSIDWNRKIVTQTALPSMEILKAVSLTAFNISFDDKAVWVTIFLYQVSSWIYA